MGEKKGKVFLVDTENINNYSFLKKYKTDSEDLLILFSSTNSKPLKLTALKEIINSEITLETEEVEVGKKNAMDHQIIINLTLMCVKNKNKDYYIVSDDSDYNFPINYLKKKLSVSIRQLKISAMDLKNNPKEKELTNYENKIRTELRVMFPTKYKTLLPDILSLVYSSKDIGDFHNNLYKIVGNDSKNLYNKIKNTVKKMREINKSK